MRTTLKHTIATLAVLMAGGMTLSAQPRGADRLPRILDPLGILPRQVLRSLDHVTRVLPPVVIGTGNDPVYDYDCAYGGYPARGYFGPLPVRRNCAEIVPYSVPSRFRGYPYYGYEHRSYHREPVRTYGHGHPVYGGRR
jgi:hypothetical protein